MKSIFFISLFLISCNLVGQTKNINSIVFFGCWVDSREENEADSKISIYRPCDYKEFPQSRFRFKMVLRPDYSCSWLYLAPNDGHKLIEGKWYFDKEKSILKILNLRGGLVKRFNIEEIEKDKMSIKN